MRHILPAIFIALVSLCAVCGAVQSAVAAAARDLVVNGDLRQGTGNAPTGWSHDAWLDESGASSFEWHRTAAGGELAIVNHQENDARWIQHLHLAPGWYHFTAEIRSAGVGGGHLGAALAIMPGWLASPDLRGDHDWQSVDLYLHVGAGGADVELACRLGGYSNGNTGTAGCRNIHGYASSAPSADNGRNYELDAEALARPSSGWGVSVSVAAGAIVLMLALFVWHTRSFAAPPARAAPVVQAHARRPIELSLILVTLLTYAYFYQASDHSVACRIDMVRAMLERHTLWIDGYAGYNTADILQYRGHIFPAKAPGLSIAGLPAWLAARALLAPLASVLSDGRYWAFATYLTTLCSVGLVVSLLTVLMYRCAIVLGLGEGRAVAVALLLGFATIMLPYATEFTGEPMAAAASLAAFYLLAKPRDAASRWRDLGAGFLAGWSVLCDFTTAVIAVALAAYALWRLRRTRPIAAFGLGAAIALAILLIHNTTAFGNPFFVSYEGLAMAGTQFPEHQVGFLSVTSFDPAVLWKVAFLPQRGLFYCNPVLLLAFPGMIYWWRRAPTRRAELAVVACVIFSFFYLNGSFVDSIRIWGGGTSVGPRHLIAIVPFMVLALAFLPASFDLPVAILAIVSVGLMLMATAVDPHLPYEYDRPIRDFLWPAYLRGDLALNRDAFFGGAPVVGDAVAFNLGKLAGLPGALQLIPLLALWAVLGARLLRQLQPPAWAGRRWPRIAIAAALLAIFAPPTLGPLFDRAASNRTAGLLGRYYAGLQPGIFPPHIVRVDPRIDFDDLVGLGSLPAPWCALWSGQIYAPTTGLYRFHLRTDDAAWLTIDGRAVIAATAAQPSFDRDGAATLSAGWHRIELGARHLWGGDEIHLLWQPPATAAQPVPATDLKPAAAGTIGRN